MGAGAARVQLATYPQSTFSGPARCCDVTDLYQAFSQRTGPGRLWISLDAGLLFVWIWGKGQTPGQTSPNKRPKQKTTERKSTHTQKKLILPILLNFFPENLSITIRQSVQFVSLFATLSASIRRAPPHEALSLRSTASLRVRLFLRDLRVPIFRYRIR